MEGKRVYPNAGGFLHVNAGEYGCNPNGKGWTIRPPGTLRSLIIPNARVTEHDDTTITVAGEIGLYDISMMFERKEWHGTLIHGVWKQA